MTASILIYGANGYTGELVSRRAVEMGLAPILSGRSGEKVRALADELGCEAVVVDVGDSAGLRRALEPVSTVVNCAGPFVETWGPMTAACLATRTHYLDITGEHEVLSGCAALDDQAREAGITIMPGTGFDVVPTDCMAAMLVERLPEARRITLAFAGLGQPSRGTATTAAAQIPKCTLVRRDGKLVPREGPLSTHVDFGDGPVEVMAISWGDIVTAWHTTGVPDIEVFFRAPKDTVALLKMPMILRRLIGSPLGRPLVRAQLAKMPAGPDEAAREKGSALVYGRAETPAGESVELRMRTVDGYKLTSITAATIAQAAAEGTLPAGFTTPAGALGADFILSIEGSRMLN
jgi:short subunit dehydrogenase-like uncharacterized protein